ncbi:MAG: ABC transporter ATP-binding protein [Anaerolineae bacterium]|nr:ABC transporter ATP-binding protein [Anaerolineae bacterium]
MTNAIEMRGIRKYFASTQTLAVDGVDLAVAPGEVHALVGENGAGKTTLMSILYGMVSPDEGEIFINGNRAHIKHPNDAIRNGIGMVHQHFKLVPSFTVAENIMLGIERNRAGFVNSRAESDDVRRLAAEFGLAVNPNQRVADLPVGMQQRVEILKTLQRDARILILDEPTAVLTPQEVNELYTVIRKLADTGRAIILITHKLLEVKAAADQVTIMRRGQHIGTYPVAGLTVNEMANQMVGRTVLLDVEKTPAQPGDTVISAENLLVAANGGVPAVFGVSFEVRRGEILGIAGVSGNGQTELVDAVAGMRPVESGEIRFLNQIITNCTVRERRIAGMAHIPEDRMDTGLNLKTTLDENVISTAYYREPFSRGWRFQFEEVRAFAQRVIDSFQIKSASVKGSIRTLSGGNLQKIVLGRELEGHPKFIIANQPTRGLDVGSIEFVHKTLIAARDAGAAVLLISVELEEIMSLSDRIAVMYEGRITGILDGETATEQNIAILMTGGSLDDAVHAGAVS